LFLEAFPGQRIPRAIVSRLRRELAKLSDRTGDDAKPPYPQSALTTLYQLLEKRGSRRKSRTPVRWVQQVGLILAGSA
jgi:hypothetical protein